MSGKAFMNRSADGNFFPTPYSMTEQLFEVETFDFSASVLEPACGHGHMVKVLKNKFKNIDYYDIESEDDSFKLDFYQEKQKYDYIITNPPYGKEADKFVMKAKEVCKVKFAMLLRTNYLSGQGRFEAKVYEGLKSVHIFTRMSDLTAPIREDGKYPTAGIVYSWLIWETGYTGKPQIDWIDNQKYVLKKKDI